MEKHFVRTAILAALLAGPAAAGVVNGGFETGDFTGWRVASGTMPSPAVTDAAPASEGRWYASFPPETFAGIGQTVDVRAGQAYRLSFDLAALGAGGGFELSFGDLLLDVQPDLAPSGWTRFEYRVRPVAASARLDFLFHAGAGGYALDNVSLVATGFGSAPPPPSAVPEPAAWATMILGFGAIGSALRRSRRAPRPA